MRHSTTYFFGTLIEQAVDCSVCLVRAFIQTANFVSGFFILKKAYHAQYR